MVVRKHATYLGGRAISMPFKGFRHVRKLDSKTLVGNGGFS